MSRAACCLLKRCTAGPTTGSSQEHLETSTGMDGSRLGSRSHHLPTGNGAVVLGACCMRLRCGESAYMLTTPLGAWMIMTPRSRAAVRTALMRGAITPTRWAADLQ